MTAIHAGNTAISQLEISQNICDVDHKQIICFPVWQFTLPAICDCCWEQDSPHIEQWIILSDYFLSDLNCNR
jgi:hypothetical protein